MLGIGDVPEPALPVGPRSEPGRDLDRGQVHRGGDLVDGGAVGQGVGDVHPPAGEHPVGEGVFDREQRDGVPGQLLGGDRVSDRVAGVDESALVVVQGIEDLAQGCGVRDVCRAGWQVGLNGHGAHSLPIKDPAGASIAAPGPPWLWTPAVSHASHGLCVRQRTTAVASGR